MYIQHIHVAFFTSAFCSSGLLLVFRVVRHLSFVVAVGWLCLLRRFQLVVVFFSLLVVVGDNGAVVVWLFCDQFGLFIAVVLKFQRCGTQIVIRLILICGFLVVGFFFLW